MTYLTSQINKIKRWLFTIEIVVNAKDPYWPAQCTINTILFNRYTTEMRSFAIEMKDGCIDSDDLIRCISHYRFHNLHIIYHYDPEKIVMYKKHYKM